MSKQWHENLPPQAELFRVVKFHSKTRTVMFGLTGATKYKYIPNYSDMRGGYDKLSGVVRSLGENPENGTAYVFMSKNQKLVKIIRYDKGRCLYYSQKFKGGFSFVRLRFNVDKPVYVLEWKYLVSLMGTPVIKEIPVRELECLEPAA